MVKTSAIDFTLVIGCIINCMYCPQSKLVSEYFKDNKNRKRELDFEDFVKILDTVEPGSTVSFAGMAEPFLNNRCADMICYAYDRGYKISLCTTLQGMTEEDFDKICKIKFDRFVLHIPDNEKYAYFNIDDTYMKLLQRVHREITIDYYSCHGTPHKDIRSIVDMNRIDRFNAQDRAGNLEMEEVVHHDWKGKIVCYRVWSAEAMCLSWLPEVLPDGTVLLCCQDYGMEHPLGNIIEEDWDSIFHGEGMKRYVQGLNDESIKTICRKCECARPYTELPPICLSDAVSGSLDYSDASEKTKNIVESLKKSADVVSFGMGKLFDEHFFQEYWNVGLDVSYITDNKIQTEKKYRGINVIPVASLGEIHNAAVIIFLKRNIDEIKKQLTGLGVKTIFTIDEIVTVCNELYRCKKKGK